ncbi:MAG: SPFH domain-containing protein [archaeon]
MENEKKQVAVFLALISFIIAAVASIIIFKLYNILVYLGVLLIVFLVIYTQASKMLIVAKEYERVVIFRRGKYLKTAGPGWIFLLPFIDTYTLVDLRTTVADIKPQEVVSKDNIELKIDAIIYYKVVNPEKAVLSVEDYKKSAVSYIQAALRDVVGKMTASDVISSVEEINKILTKAISEISQNWGIKVDKVELQAVELPKELLEAMHQRRVEEQRKLAAKERAEAKKIEILALQEAAGKLSQPTLHYLYLQALEKIAEGKSNKIIFPLELSKFVEALSSKLGISYEDAQKKILEEYTELGKEYKSKRDLINQLKKNLENLQD